MAKELIIGREREIRQLRNCFESKESQLVVVYGRRRVGKSFLINQTFEDEFAFKLVGDAGADRKTQLGRFHRELTRRQGQEGKKPSSWEDAFELLRDHLDNQPKENRLVVFFDEMPWLDTQKSGFLSAFEYFWNSYGASKNNLMMIVCGSATSYLVDNFDHNKGGLFNRQNLRLYLEPFNLWETEEFLAKKKNISWSRYDIAECYMVFGGIPYYLNMLDRDLSYSANIDNILFRKKGVLWDEFDHLYNTLFSNSEAYIKVIETLLGKRIGLTRTELATASGLSNNTEFTKILRNLQDSGFIRTNPMYGKKKRGLTYQVSDYYTLFYYRFVKEHYGADEDFWSHSLDNPKRRIWAGLTFENLCRDHIRQIKNKINILGISSETSSWYAKPEENRKGAQIDMLIDRRDRVVNICEMKFSETAFEIDREYEEDLRDKMQVFRDATGTKKALQLVLVSAAGLKKNSHSGLVQCTVTLDDLFTPLAY